GTFVVAIVTVAIVTIPNRLFLESCCASSMEQQRRILRASNIGQETKTFLTELIHIHTHTLSLCLSLSLSLSLSLCVCVCGGERERELVLVGCAFVCWGEVLCVCVCVRVCVRVCLERGRWGI